MTYICCFIAKRRGMSLTNVRSAIAGPTSSPFTVFKADQYTYGQVQNVGCVCYCCCSYYVAARYTCKSGLAVADFDRRHLIAKPSTRQMQGSW